MFETVIAAVDSTCKPGLECDNEPGHPAASNPASAPEPVDDPDDSQSAPTPQPESP